MMDLAVSLGVLVSVSTLVWLALRDPKRLRVLGRGRAAAATALRRRATLIVLAPGAAFTGCAAWAELLIWAGAVLAAGWLLTQMLAVRADQPAANG